MKLINVNLLVGFIFVTLISVAYGFEIKKEDYTGDGKFFVKVRDYGVGKTYGYDIQFEPFITNSEFSETYTIIGLPSTVSKIYDYYRVNFEIVIGEPKSRSELEMAVTRSNSMPKEHEILYTLKDSKTQKVITSGKKKVYSLEPTHHHEYYGLGLLHMKNMFGIEASQISKHTNFELSIKYLINGVPTDDKVFIIISLMAPTA